MNLRFLKVSMLVCCTILLNSCLLKDTPYMDVSNTAPIIQFGLSPASGYSGIMPYTTDTSGSPVVDTAVALVIASPQVLNYGVNITVRIDTTQISAYNASNGTNFTLLPDSLYSITDTTVNIPAGFRVGGVPIVLNFPLFPASYNYALPLLITNGGGLLISGNSSTFMWLFQQ